MSEDEQIWRAYLIAAGLLAGEIKDGTIDKMGELNKYSQEDTAAIKKHMQGIINFHYSMGNHYLKKTVT